MLQPPPITRSLTGCPEQARSPSRWMRATALLAGVMLVSACERTPPDPTPPPMPEAPPKVVAKPVLDRAALLSAMDQAASTFAAGREEAGASLAGRRFQIRQAFGCGGPAALPATAPEGVASVIAMAKSNDLRLSLVPADWTTAIAAVPGTGAWEAAEGFWLSWPWLHADTCPRPPQAIIKTPVADTSEASTEDPQAHTALISAPSPQTAALVAVFEVDSSRLKRRMGRAYDFIVRGEGGTAPTLDPDGYRVVLEGRMAAFEDGSSIRCRAFSADQRPICGAAIHLERVAFETSTGTILSEWRGG